MLVEYLYPGKAPNTTFDPFNKTPYKVNNLVLLPLTHSGSNAGIVVTEAFITVVVTTVTPKVERAETPQALEALTLILALALPHLTVIEDVF